MLTDGLILMVMGMGTVFVFLTLMVLIINVTHKILKPFEHLLEEPAPKKPASRKRKPAPAPTPAAPVPHQQAEDNSLFAAIASAVHKYREENE